MALDMWLLGCMMFVFAALMEYAVLLKIRYGNASTSAVRKSIRKQSGGTGGRVRQ
jgi:hypothetical protein